MSSPKTSKTPLKEVTIADEVRLLDPTTILTSSYFGVRVEEE
jgi:hypothetical protein